MVKKSHKNGANVRVNEHGATISGKQGTIITLPELDYYPLDNIPKSFVNGTKQKIADKIAAKHRCIYNPAFDNKNRVHKFFSLNINIDRNSLAWYDHFADKGDTNAPEVQLLSTEEERQMFLRFNYVRYLKYLRVAHVRNNNITDKRVYSSIVSLDQVSDKLRDLIILSNIGLIYTIMRKGGLRSRRDKHDLFDQGVIALTNAINCFDVSRGYKFSTYCCRSIQKEMFRYIERESRKQVIYSFSVDDGVNGGVDGENSAEHDDFERLDTEMLYNDIISGINSDRFGLTEDEKFILHKRFLEGFTLVDTAQECKKQFRSEKALTKERIRQKQKTALSKIRVNLGLEEPEEDEVEQVA